jgi:type VI secretion system secreted protein VgrG
MGVSCPLGPDALLLRRALVTEELGHPFSIDADLFSTRADLPFDDVVGAPFALWLRREDGRVRWWHGVASAFDQVGEQGGLALYRVTVVPTLWRLSQRTDCRIFQHQSVPDIVREVLRQHAVTPVESPLSGTYPTREFVVQYRESDLDFVLRLMEQEGIYPFFVHDADGCRTVLADAPSAHRPADGYESVPYRPTTDPSGAEAVREWVISARLSTGQVALDDFDFAAPSKHLLARTAAPRRPGADLEAFDYPGRYTDLSDGERYARLRLEEIEARRSVIRARADARGLATGALFTLAAHPRADQRRRWLVTRAEHTLVSDEFEPSPGAPHAGEPIYRCRFEALDAAVPFRPARRTPRPCITGPQTAIVVGPRGEEIHTDNHARVRVRFHWDRYAPGDDRSSCFIRVNQPWAGKGWGGIQIPRVGQEVIVEFLEGDPDRPIITGRVYNAESTPPVSPAGRDQSKGEVNPRNAVEAAMQMSLRSNSLGGSGGHNEITMHDAGGAEKLFIRAQKDEVHLVQNDRKDTVGHDETRDVGNDRTRKVGNDEKVDVGKDQTVHVGRHIHIKAGSTITIEVGLSKITMNKAGIISITGTMITTAGAANVNIAAPITNVAGGVMLNLAGMSTNLQGMVTAIDGSSIVSITGKKIDSIAETDQIIKASGKIKLNPV